MSHSFGAKINAPNECKIFAQILKSIASELSVTLKTSQRQCCTCYSCLGGACCHHLQDVN
jgi:nicotinamide mononucleotide (NMN) deamidase PncC